MKRNNLDFHLGQKLTCICIIFFNKIVCYKRAERYRNIDF